MRLLRAAVGSIELLLFGLLVSVGIACGTGKRIEPRGTPVEILGQHTERKLNGDLRYYLKIRFRHPGGPSETHDYEVTFLEWMRWKERGEACVSPGFGRPRLFECY